MTRFVGTKNRSLYPLGDGLIEILNDENIVFDSVDIANFVLKLGKQGSGLRPATAFSLSHRRWKQRLQSL